MRNAIWRWCLVCGCIWTWGASWAAGQDWPQWRGPNRDAKASGFNAPANWPQQLTEKWKVTIGDGVATPAVVGDRVFVFSREAGNEIVRSLNAANGEELWQDKYKAAAPRGGASNYPGPRSSPTVADGKVVTLGVEGTLSCYDGASGKLLWRKNDFENEVPMFYVSSSPIIVDGLCIAQLGGEDDGGIVAYDLASGNEKWRWTEDYPAYGSPVLLTIGDDKMIVTPTNKKLVAVGVADGKTKWEMPYEQGRYNTVTPVISNGNMVIIGGPGTGISAFKIMKITMPDGSKLVEEQSWKNSENSLQFNSPVLKDKLLFGLSNAGQLFCINIDNASETAWKAPIVPQAEGEQGEGERSARNRAADSVPAGLVQFVQQEEREERQRDGRGFDRDRRRGEGGGRDGRGRGRGGRGRGGRGGGGYGSIVDAGDVLLALSPAGQLVVFKPTDEAYSEVARYKVATEGTYAYPVPAGDAIYTKDRDSVTRWSFE